MMTLFNDTNSFSTMKKYRSIPHSKQSMEHSTGKGCLVIFLFQNSPNSLPARVRYGMPVWSSKCYLISCIFHPMLHVISCDDRPCQNGNSTVFWLCIDLWVIHVFKRYLENMITVNTEYQWATLQIWSDPLSLSVVFDLGHHCFR